jgi:hypothetical protein
MMKSEFPHELVWAFCKAWLLADLHARDLW